MSAWNSGWLEVHYYDRDCVGYADLTLDGDGWTAQLTVTITWVDMETMGPVGTRAVDALHVKLCGGALRSSMYDPAEEPSRDLPGDEYYDLVDEAKNELGLDEEDDLPDDVELEVWDTYRDAAQPGWTDTGSRQLTATEATTLKQLRNDNQSLPIYLGNLLLAELHPTDISGTDDGQHIVSDADEDEPHHLWTGPQP